MGKRSLAARLKKNLFAELLATDVVPEIETLLGRQAVEDLDLEALELAVRQQVLQLAGAAVEQRLNADTSDERGSRIRCACGQEARWVGRRSKRVHSVLGPLHLERAYYHCSSCGHGFCPRDEQLGIENTSLSPALTRMVGTVGAMVSFQEGSELLTELAGVPVDAKQVERTAEALGKEIAEDERLHSEPLDTLPLPQTLYLGMDGTGIPLRAEELVGRTGKQPDGSAKTGEVKLCTIWSAESLDEEGTPIRDDGSVTYSAALESACALDTAAARSPFAQRVWREATRRRFCQAPRRVVLGDGALWIWNIADDQFSDATQIVDRYHAKQHLSDLGKALYGLTALRAAQWAERRKEELDTGRFRALLIAIRRQVTRCDAARRCLHYFQTNRERMRYPEFHAQGLCTSTGVVEAGCKVAIGTRLKRAGMHWTKQGANAIIALRCSKLSGRFQDFWERRSERRAA
ncbi:MAG: ISKra4 family transposase [Acidobacteria bacterium]|nr:MAG: ISKra4 family transposase [Acidobacteriota bacterium]